MLRLSPSFLPAALLGLALSAQARSTNDWFGIHVVDDTGRGVPLVELETVNHLRYMTDNAGWAAIQEPGWEKQSVFFSVKSHGYEFPKDPFGSAGFAVVPTPGKRHTIKIHRRNLAERLYRLTGEGLYRDSILLGERAPVAEPLLNAQVVGQDSAQVARFHDRLYWFMGDTSRLRYPLGNFHTSGAWTALPGSGGFDPSAGIDLHYWTDKEGFSRGMCPLDGTDGPYLVWIDGVINVPDATGKEHLVTHYEKMRTLGKRLGHGLAAWDESKAVFEPVLQLPDQESWRFVLGHPFRSTTPEGDYIYSGDNFPNTRVRARYEEVIDPSKYEAFTCITPESAQHELKPSFDAQGSPAYNWTHDAPPVTTRMESAWFKGKMIAADQCRFSPRDVASGKPIQLHYGNTRWSQYRKRWIAIAVESGGTSALGEVWYCESESLTGPWQKAVKIATHDHYSFYNPFFHDASFDHEDGRIAYFEGTYSNTFSGNGHETSRYDYNQIMYRLDLSKAAALLQP